MKGERVILRPLERGDLERCVRWINDPDVTRYLGKTFPFSFYQEEKWFEKMSEDKNTKIFAIEVDGTHIGTIGLHDMNRKDNNVDLGILIGEKEYWGKGCGTDAIKTLLRFVFHQMNFHRVYLTVYDFNKRAIRCYEKCGFKTEVVMRQWYFADGEYHDTHLMGILEEEFK
jgi:RimJ/RimL family protein N-acetyltransferase